MILRRGQECLGLNSGGATTRYGGNHGMGATTVWGQSRYGGNHGMGTITVWGQSSVIAPTINESAL